MARTSNAGRVLLAALVVTAAFSGVGLAATATTQDCSFPFSKVDETETEVTVEEEPERIVTLSPSAAQTMWELGAQDKVVGVTKFATYLDGAEEKANVSGAGRTAIVNEKVVAQEPDLVLAPNTISNETVAALRESGLTVYRFGAATSLDDIAEKTLLTGELVGECESARQSVDRMTAELDTVDEAVGGEEGPRVLFLLGSSGYTAGTGTFIHTAVETAGGENVAEEANISFYQTISPEVVAERDPEWIVTPAGVEVPDTEAYNGTTAVQEGNVLAVDGNYISQPAPQIVQSIRAMAKAFHPEAYAEANATPTATPSPTDVDTPTPGTTDATTPTPTPTTGPGFGPVAALVALVATLVLARRRER